MNDSLTIDASGLSAFDAMALLIVLAAALGWLNRRFLGLPQAVGLTAMGLLASLSLAAADRLLPGRVSGDLLRLIDRIDFHAALINGMLSFLLFAAAVQVNWSDLRKSRLAVLTLSTAGVLLSTMLVGAGLYLAAPWLGIPLPLGWCLVFGALISPTDPVAVTDALKRIDVNGRLRATVAGESLFNDGVGVVVFTVLLSGLMSAEPLSLSQALGMFVVQAGGGVLLGLAAGWLAFQAMRRIDDFQVEVMISLAVVTGGYALAQAIGISGPVAMVVAGLIVGNHAVENAMSDQTQDYLLKFWSVVEELLNAMLFLLIGIEIVNVSADWHILAVCALVVPLVMAVRWVSVRVPLGLIGRFGQFGPLTTITLVWGGLRGGISVALALSLPEGPARAILLAATYAIVLFAVIVQGGSFERVLARHPGSSDK